MNRIDKRDARAVVRQFLILFSSLLVCGPDGIACPVLMTLLSSRRQSDEVLAASIWTAGPGVGAR